MQNASKELLELKARLDAASLNHSRAKMLYDELDEAFWMLRCKEATERAQVIDDNSWRA